MDGSELARTFFTFAALVGAAMFRPLDAVHMTAGHNALRGSGPGQNLAFEMQWHEWVVLIAGSTGSALRAVRPPNLHITPDARRDLVMPQRDGIPVTLAPGHHRPGHSGELIGERDGSDLGRPPRQQCREPGPMLVPWILA